MRKPSGWTTARPKRSHPLRFGLAVVQPDGFLIALQRVYQRDDEVGRAGNVAQLRSLLEQITGERRKSLLAHIGLGNDRRNETLNQLEIAGYVAFELGAYDVDLGQDVSARQLIGDLSVPLVGNQGTDEKHNKGNRRRQVGGRKNGPFQPAGIERRSCQFDPNTFPGQ